MRQLKLPTKLCSAQTPPAPLPASVGDSLPWAARSSSARNRSSPAQAQALVGRALATEIRTAQDPNHPMRYLLRKTSPRLTTTKEIVETRDGAVARLLSINDKPLSQANEQKEQARLDAWLSDPSLQRHRKQGEDAGYRALCLKLLRMLPNAFLYQYAGLLQAHRDTLWHGREIHIQAQSRDSAHPTTRRQALTALSGEIWIDPAQERVTRLEGHLQQDTDYGWGILGKLDKGGWVSIEQADVGGRQWRITHVQMEMSAAHPVQDQSLRYRGANEPLCAGASRDWTTGRPSGCCVRVLEARLQAGR